MDGGKILGSFPDVLSDDGPLVFGPGIVIPTLPFDALLNGVAEWFGITDDNVSICLLFLLFGVRARPRQTNSYPVYPLTD